MKPWEETWESYWDSDYAVTLKRSDGARLGIISAGGPEGVARAKLAAAAPDLARVLLDLERQGVFHQRQCSSCFQHNPGDPVPTVVEHRSGCKLDAALRKAGVR